MSNAYISDGDQLPKVAYYYPEPYWIDSDWVKNLILFFDGVAVLVPDYMPEINREETRPIIAALKSKGLFHVLQPEQIVDEVVSEQLIAIMEELIEAGVLDNLPKNSPFAAISMSRMGFGGSELLAHRLLEKLVARGLALYASDGKSIPLQSSVRSLFLVVLTQILQSRGASLGYDLFPATDRPKFVDGLNHLLRHPQMPTAGHVVSFDMKELGVDLSSVPIDEVLSFRVENQIAYREYLLEVRRFVRELSVMQDGAERQLALIQRGIEIDERGKAILAHAQKVWRKPVAFGLGLIGTGIGVGGATTLAGAPPTQAVIAGLSASAIGGMFRMAGAIVGGVGQEKKPDLGCFSYMFKAKSAFGC